jgi:RHS repeat-associated protein
VSTNLVPVTFTHLASGSEKHIVASVPPETPPRASSAFGNTTLFQGRLWVPELGLYYYRARWYDPQLADFLERDPLGPVDSPNLYQAFGRNPINITDPQGLYEKDFHFYAVYYLARAAGFARADARLLAWSSQYVDNYEHTQPLTADFSTLGGFHFLSPARFVEQGVCTYARYGEQRCPTDRILVQDPVEKGWRNAIAVANIERAKFVSGQRGAKLIALGIALHSWADTFAHSGYSGTADFRNIPANANFWWWNLWVNAAPLVGAGPIGHGPAGHEPDRPYTDVPKALEAAKSIYDLLVSFGSAHGYSREPMRPWDESLTKRLNDLFSLRENDEERRARAWEAAIREDFRGDQVHYERKGFYDAVPKVVNDFARLVEEQRRCVLGLEIGSSCSGAR